MANVPVRISRAIVQREGATGSFPPPVADTDPVINDPLNPPGSGGGVGTFVELTDTPDNYVGEAGKIVAVKGDESGLEFISGGGGRDEDAVHYDVDDGKNATEKQRARTNIGLAYGIPQNVDSSTSPLNIDRTTNFIVITGTNNSDLRGLSAGLLGERVFVINFSTGTCTVTNEQAGTTANRRINLVGGANILTLTTGQGIELFYNTNIDRWVQLNRFVRSEGDDIKAGSLFLDMTGGQRLELSGQGGLNFTNPILRLFPNTSNDRTALGIFESGGQRRFGIRFDGLTQFLNSSNVETIQFNSSSGRIIQAKSGAQNESVRRDELYLNYQETITDSGQIDDLAIGEGTKLLRFTLATDITGIIPSTTANGRLVRIYNDTGGNLTIKNNDTDSTAANRFDIGSDFVIPDKQFKSFIYIQSRWRIEA